MVVLALELPATGDRCSAAAAPGTVGREREIEIAGKISYLTLSSVCRGCTHLRLLQIIPHCWRHILLLLLLLVLGANLLGHGILETNLLSCAHVLLRLLRVLLVNGRAVRGLLVLLLLLQLLIVLAQIGGIDALLRLDDSANRDRGHHDE